MSIANQNRSATKAVKKLAALSLLIGAGVVFLGHGCGKFETVNSNGGSSSIQDSASGDFLPIPGARTVGTVYAKQVLDNMVSCAGIGGESAVTRGVWEDRKGSLSEFGYATRISGPMQMSIASIAGEVCRDLIDQDEKRPDGSRFVFNGFDLGNNPNRMPASADIGQAAERLALSCWQRRMDQEERAILESSLGEAFSGTPASYLEVRNVALMLCTGFLTSLSAIEQ